MILVWSGWGILAVLVPGLVAFLAYSAAQAAGLAQADAFAALGAAVGGVACWFIGARLEGGDPTARVAAYRQQRQAELHALVEAGVYRGLGGVRPTSLQDAREQAARQLDAECAGLTRSMTNRHSFFWVPLRWCGLAVVVGGIVAAVALGLRG